MRYEVNHIRKFTKKDSIKLFERVLILIAVVAPLMNTPQIFKIYYLKTAAGLSLISWSMYAILDIPWIVYASIHKTPQLLIAYSLWFITNLIVVIGILMYG